MRRDVTAGSGSPPQNKHQSDLMDSFHACVFFLSVVFSSPRASANEAKIIISAKCHLIWHNRLSRLTSDQAYFPGGKINISQKEVARALSGREARGAPVGLATLEKIKRSSSPCPPPQPSLYSLR